MDVEVGIWQYNVFVYSYFVILNYDYTLPGRLLQVLHKKGLLHLQCIFVQNIGVCLHRTLHFESSLH